ncbi:unnamed protein product, partial [Laminaria digitata]
GAQPASLRSPSRRKNMLSTVTISISITITLVVILTMPIMIAITIMIMDTNNKNIPGIIAAIHPTVGVQQIFFSSSHEELNISPETWLRINSFPQPDQHFYTLALKQI